MFFPNKKKADADAASESNRAQYRKRAAKSQRLEASLRVDGWEPVDVELVDLTIRGAGLVIPFATDRNLKVGDVVELVISSMMRDEITTAARVVNSKPENQTHVRYGFEFLNLGNLYSQLDSFYARHFNRRRHQRVIPALDRKIHATLSWPGGELRVHVYDISERGVGLALTRDSATMIGDAKRFQVAFKLPGTMQDIRAGLQLKQRSQLKTLLLLGFEFDFDGQLDITPHVAALRDFVARRAAEMAQWEAKSKVA